MVNFGVPALSIYFLVNLLSFFTYYKAHECEDDNSKLTSTCTFTCQCRVPIDQTSRLSTSPIFSSVLEHPPQSQLTVKRRVQT
jgi:hypothetical protein